MTLYSHSRFAAPRRVVVSVPSFILRQLTSRPVVLGLLLLVLGIIRPLGGSVI
jgi:hypothetical protein